MKNELRLAARLSDYVHYANTYGNAAGECETGYPQHPDYVCGMCGQDRSTERKCGRAVIPTGDGATKD